MRFYGAWTARYVTSGRTSGIVFESFCKMLEHVFITFLLGERKEKVVEVRFFELDRPADEDGYATDDAYEKMHANIVEWMKAIDESGPFDEYEDEACFAAGREMADFALGFGYLNGRGMNTREMATHLWQARPVEKSVVITRVA